MRKLYKNNRYWINEKNLIGIMVMGGLGIVSISTMAAVFTGIIVVITLVGALQMGIIGGLAVSVKHNEDQINVNLKNGENEIQMMREVHNGKENTVKKLLEA